LEKYKGSNIKIGQIEREDFTAAFNGSWSSMRRSKGVNQTRDTDLEEDIEITGAVAIDREITFDIDV